MLTCQPRECIARTEVVWSVAAFARHNITIPVPQVASFSPCASSSSVASGSNAFCWEADCNTPDIFKLRSFSCSQRHHRWAVTISCFYIESCLYKYSAFILQARPNSPPERSYQNHPLGDRPHIRLPLVRQLWHPHLTRVPMLLQK